MKLHIKIQYFSKKIEYGVLLNILKGISFFACVAFTVFFVSCSKSINVGSDQQSKFVKLFGGSKMGDAGSHLVQCPDGGFAVTGTRLAPNNTTEAFLIRTDKFGNELPWSPVYIGSTLNTKGRNILYTNDGNFLITGSVETSSNNLDVMVAKVSSSGSIIWYKTFGGTGGNDEGYCALESGSGNYFIGGYTETASHPYGGKDELLINLDVNGNLIGQNNYGTPQDDQCNQILSIGNNLLLVGTTYGYHLPDTIPNLYLYTVDPANHYLAIGSQYYGGLVRTTGVKGVLTNDTSVIVMGNQQFADSSRIYLVNCTGNIYNIVYTADWEQNIPSSNNEWGYDMILNSGQVLTVGSVESSLYQNFLIQPFNLTGTSPSAIITIATGNQTIYSGIISSDNHLVYTGQYSFDGVSQIVLVKTDLPD